MNRTLRVRHTKRRESSIAPDPRESVQRGGVIRIELHGSCEIHMCLIEHTEAAILESDEAVRVGSGRKSEPGECRR